MDCTLHIGTEKTGTTSIQAFMDLNRSLLIKEARTLYPMSLGRESNRGLSFLGYNPDQSDDYNLRHQILTPEATQAHQQFLFHQIQSEINEHRSAIDRVIFSSEHLQSRLWMDEQLLRLKNTLERLDLNISQIILYIRNPVETAFSLYSTVIKGGVPDATLGTHDSPYINRICNHRDTILRWGNIFGVEKLTIRLYRTDLFFQGELLSDFRQIAKLPEHLPYQMPIKKNLSLDWTGIEILRRVNKKIPNFIDGKPNPLRSNITTFFERNCSLGKKITPSKELIDQYELFYKESNEWVRAHYFNHLESLFVSPPSEENVMTVNVDEVVNLISDIWLAAQKRDVTTPKDPQTNG